MKFTVNKPANSIYHKVVQLPCVTEKRTPGNRNFIKSGCEIWVNCPKNSNDALILEAQMMPEVNYDGYTAVLSSSARDELGVDVGDEVTVDAVGRSLAYSNVRDMENLGSLSSGVLHVFGASSYRDNTSEFVSEVLNPQLGGQVIAEGVGYTLSKNWIWNQTDETDVYECEVHFESCKPSPAVYARPTNLDGSWSPEVIIHKEGVYPYDVL